MLHIFVARTSFAQERIFLDESIRFSSKEKKNMYVIPLVYRISSSINHVSITRLYDAFEAVIRKHNILRTALFVDTNGIIMQHCLDSSVIIADRKPHHFSILTLEDNDTCNIIERIEEILNDSDLFDLSKGRVISCHVLHQHRPDDDLLTNDDLILISIHHSVFDGTSIPIFLADLCFAYENNSSLLIDDNVLQYIDYSVYERLIDMTSSREFWRSQLQEYNFEQSLSLRVDRHRSSTDQRSGLASVAQISFDKEASKAFFDYASSHQLTPFQLGLATFYVFLFKLTHGQTDMCIASVHANRYRSELQKMIGMFVSTLPNRIQLDSYWSFDGLVKYVKEKCLSILEHSHYPLQHIFSDSHFNQSNPPFLEIMFDFMTFSSKGYQLSLNGTNLEEVSIEKSYEVSKFDVMLTFIYNPASDNNPLSCRFICSRDTFDETTVFIIAARFQHLFNQLFLSNTTASSIDRYMLPITKLNLILPEETEEIKNVVFYRQSNIINEGMLVNLFRL